MAVDPATPVRILTRNDVPNRWFSANPTLGLGELAIERNQAGNVTGIKVGNAQTPWRDLEYLNIPVNAFYPRTEGYKLTTASTTIQLAQQAQYLLYVSIDGNIVLPDTNIPDTDYVLQPDKRTIVFTELKPIGTEILIVYIVDGLDLENSRVLDQGYVTFDIEPGTVIQRYTYALPYKFIMNYSLQVGNPIIQMKVNNVNVDYLQPQTIEVGQVVDLFLSSTNPQSCVTFRIDRFDAVFVPDGNTGGSNNTKRIVTQTNHNFVKGDLLIDTANGYSLALATTDLLAEVIGIVESVVDANNFVLVTGGEFNSTGLTLIPGKAYFLSHLLQGKLSATPPPNIIGYVRKPVVIGGRNNNSYFVNYLGSQTGIDGSTGGPSLPPDWEPNLEDFVLQTEKNQPGGIPVLDAQVELPKNYLRKLIRDDLNASTTETYSIDKIKELIGTGGGAVDLSGYVERENAGVQAKLIPTDTNNTSGYWNGLVSNGKIELANAINRLQANSNLLPQILLNDQTINPWNNFHGLGGNVAVTTIYFPNELTRLFTERKLFTGAIDSLNTVHGNAENKVELRIPYVLISNSTNIYTQTNINGLIAPNLFVNVSGITYLRVLLPTNKLFTIKISGTIVNILYEDVSSIQDLINSIDTMLFGNALFFQRPSGVAAGHNGSEIVVTSRVNYKPQDGVLTDFPYLFRFFCESSFSINTITNLDIFFDSVLDLVESDLIIDQHILIKKIHSADVTIRFFNSAVSETIEMTPHWKAPNGFVLKGAANSWFLVKLKTTSGIYSNLNPENTTKYILTIEGTSGPTIIDDVTPSAVTTYSSNKIDQGFAVTFDYIDTEIQNIYTDTAATFLGKQFTAVTATYDNITKTITIPVPISPVANYVVVNMSSFPAGLYEVTNITGWVNNGAFYLGLFSTGRQQRLIFLNTGNINGTGNPIGLLQSENNILHDGLLLYVERRIFNSTDKFYINYTVLQDNRLLLTKSVNHGNYTISGGILNLFLLYHIQTASVVINQNVTVQIDSAITNFSSELYLIADTDSSSRILTLPANSFVLGSTTLDANSKYQITLKAERPASTWIYYWTIEKFGVISGGGGVTQQEVDNTAFVNSLIYG